jgi:hypothetical protein
MAVMDVVVPPTGASGVAGCWNGREEGLRR